jgi:hypothetical protein
MIFRAGATGVRRLRSIGLTRDVSSRVPNAVDFSADSHTGRIDFAFISISIDFSVNIDIDVNVVGGCIDIHIDAGTICVCRNGSRVGRGRLAIDTDIDVVLDRNISAVSVITLLS